MDQAALKRLRPRDTSSAAIRAALAAIATAQTEATARVDAALDTRRKVLMTGSAASIREAEAAAADARLDHEQLGELARAFADDLEAALAIESASALKARAAETAQDATEKLNAWSTWWTTEYPALLSAIAAGIRLQDEARLAETVARNASDAAGALGDAVDLPEEAGPVWGASDHRGRFDVVRLGSLVQLPRPSIDSTLCIWPQTLLGREALVPHHARY